MHHSLGMNTAHFELNIHIFIRKLWDLWTEALEENNGNRVAAWASIVENEDKAKQYKQARGMGGHVRSNWKDVTDIIAAQLLYTIKNMVQIESQDLHLFQRCR